MRLDILFKLAALVLSNPIFEQLKGETADFGSFQMSAVALQRNDCPEEVTKSDMSPFSSTLCDFLSRKSFINIHCD